MPAQGVMDIEGMMKDIKAGLNFVEMFEKYPVGFARYERILTKYRSELVEHRDEHTLGIWIYGDTGVGKTRYALHYAKSNKLKFAYIHVGRRDDRVWSDGDAENADILIVEDYEGEFSKRFLLRLLDRTPFKMETKGGFVKVVAKKVIFTSEFHPSKFYGEWNKKNSLRRRFHEHGFVHHMTEQWSPEE